MITWDLARPVVLVAVITNKLEIAIDDFVVEPCIGSCASWSRNDADEITSFVISMPILESINHSTIPFFWEGSDFVLF